MKRRDFIHLSAFASLGIMVPRKAFSSAFVNIDHSVEFKELTFNLLKDWCDALLKQQIINLSNPKEHGLLKCPACNVVHPRCIDAVYPFLYMADVTGDKKYLNAGIAAFEWGENVTRPDGAWTNELNPKSWDGITAFAAMALAEALHHHGHLLSKALYEKWMFRLHRAGEFLYQRFTSIDFTNINYGASSIYVFYLLGNLLNKPEYLKRSSDFASQVKNYFTDNNHFLFGEIKPSAHQTSAKGLKGVDLGYNVEETLNCLAMYASAVNDQHLLDLLSLSMSSHLEFMLPDGGWDNSWGTRQYKWTYWGSRTCDGSQPVLALLAGINPAFGTAAIKYTSLLKECTHNGLLYGGLHYLSHGIKPCIHHTFVHAKPLTYILDNWRSIPKLDDKTPLPRSISKGIKYFEDLDTMLFATGDWRGTVTAYDAAYNWGICQQATGGSLSLLYHNILGLILSASMANYILVEPVNQQPAPGEDIALTPRIETFSNGKWFTTIFDRTATLDSSEKENEISICSNTKLVDKVGEPVNGTAANFRISYRCEPDSITITAKTEQAIEMPTVFVLPVVSAGNEPIKQISPNKIIVMKPDGRLTISANMPITIKEMPKSRTFNMVPGVEALPLQIYFKNSFKELKIVIEAR